MTNEEIIKICEKYEINNYTINSDGSIDVDGNVELLLLDFALQNQHMLKQLPLKFRNVTGNFWCDNNKLTSLEGCPQSVGGGFDCGFNQLTTLEGCPQSIGRSFYCYNNQLTTLEGGPQSVGGDFYCQDNPIYNELGDIDYKQYIKSLNRDQKLKQLGI